MDKITTNHLFNEARYWMRQVIQNQANKGQPWRVNKFNEIIRLVAERDSISFGQALDQYLEYTASN